MLKRLTAAALIALLGSVAQPALAKGKGNGSDKAATAATQTQAQKPPQAGMVWVNESSGIYHRENSRFYGKTAKGIWMTEADAKAKGYRLAGSPGIKENPAATETKPAEKAGKGKPDQAKPAGKPAKGH
jgi:hypothetical protein